MKIEIYTQYRENYEFSEGKQYWKNKGGYDYVLDVNSAELLAAEDKAAYLKAMVDAFEEATFYNDDCSSETIISWELVDSVA